MADKQDTLKHCLKWIGKIQNHEQETKLKTNRVEALQYYNMQPYGNEITNRSRIVTSDVSDTVETLLPQLMEMLGDPTNVVFIEPEGIEDEKGAKQLEKKVAYDLLKRNKWKSLNHDWIKDDALFKNGFVKVEWNEPTKKEVYKGISQDEYLQLALDNPKAEINVDKQIGAENGNSELQLKYDVTVTTYLDIGHAKIYNVPPEEIGIPHDSRSIEEAKFVYHRVCKEYWEIVKSYGKAKAGELKESVQSNKNQDTLIGDIEVQERFRDLGGYADFTYDSDSKEYVLYECYYRDSDTGQLMQVVISGDVILKEIEHPIDTIPIFTHSLVRMPHRVYGKSVYDLAGELQRLTSALWRGLLDNIYFTNNARYLVDRNRVDLNNFINANYPGAVIDGVPGGAEPLATPPLNPWIFNVIEQAQLMRETRTGAARFNQGMTGKSMHKTFRGTAMIMGAFSNRVSLMAEMIAEGMRDLIEYVVNLNIKFMRRASTIRLFNEWIEVDPENIKGRYDITVNVNVGDNIREVLISQIQQLLGIYKQLAEAGVPIVTPKNIYNAMVTLLEAMRLKHTQRYLTDPLQTDEMNAIVASTGQSIATHDMKGAMDGLLALAGRLGLNYKPTVTQPGENVPSAPQGPMEPFNPSYMTDSGMGSMMDEMAGSL